MEYICDDTSAWKVSAFGKEGWNVDKEGGYWTASYVWCARQLKVQLARHFDMKQLKAATGYRVVVKQSVAGTGPKFEVMFLEKGACRGKLLIGPAEHVVLECCLNTVA